LVSRTVPVGEPGSISTFTGGLITFTPGGFPSCVADLELQAVACTGLVPGEIYTLTDRGEQQRGPADSTGTVVLPMFIHRGAAVALGNGSRVLTTLHVARLKVKILGEETFLAGGKCQAGAYFGLPLAKVPTTTLAGLPTNPLTGGVALTEQICPLNGHAFGLPSDTINQTDELSGGQTETEVPDIEDTSPIEGETMHGRFTALAESGFALAGNQAFPTDAFTRVALKISTPRGATVLKIRNVDTARGMA